MIIDTAAASLDGPTARCEYFGAKKKVKIYSERLPSHLT